MYSSSKPVNPMPERDAALRRKSGGGTVYRKTLGGERRWACLTFSEGGRDKRFISKRKFAKVLENQADMSPQTMAALREYGVSPTDKMRLELFFITDADSKAASLALSFLDVK